MEGSKMEKALEKHIEETCRVPGATGAICVDQHGLILSSRGQVSKYAAGPVAYLAQQAATLNSQSYGSSPVIVIDTQNGKTLIKQEEGFTTAVFKS
ncbi:ragulator complex protein LAMTOR5-like [Littorina saxatilis]|uniref:Late endosomal/lysosomal adaptor and MAPK and MTOR activator 5 n=1 Tax=Littorina saxatilis TaxID=31220 RepID=A0AAN9BAU2_9CAEN